MSARLLVVASILGGIVGGLVACDAPSPPPDHPWSSPAARSEAEQPDQPDQPDQYAEFLESRTRARTLVPEVAAGISRLLDGRVAASGITEGCSFSGEATTSVEYGVTATIDDVVASRPWLDDVRFVLGELGWSVDDAGAAVSAELDGVTVRVSEYPTERRVVIGSGAACWSVSPELGSGLTGGDDEPIDVS